MLKMDQYRFKALNSAYEELSKAVYDFEFPRAIDKINCELCKLERGYQEMEKRIIDNSLKYHDDRISLIEASIELKKGNPAEALRIIDERLDGEIE